MTSQIFKYAIEILEFSMFKCSFNVFLVFKFSNKQSI